MTPAEFKAARIRMGLSQNQMAAKLGFTSNGGRTIRRYESGEYDIPGSVGIAMHHLEHCEALGKQG